VRGLSGERGGEGSAIQVLKRIMRSRRRGRFRHSGTVRGLKGVEEGEGSAIKV
jgi:hypothetical protein